MNRPPSARPPLNNAPSVAALAALPPPATADVLLLEGTLFWDKFKLPIVAAVALLALALFASEFYEMDREKKMHAASAALDNAKTPADYQRVIGTYPGTTAAANAMLLLGRQQFEAKDYAGAAGTWRNFVDKNPQNTLAPVALIGAGTALEALGKNDEARGLYQRAATSYMTSFAAPLARLDEAALLKAERKPEEARRVYENIMAADANSDAGRQAAAELRSLRVMPSTPGTALLPGAPAPPASAAPAAAIVAPGKAVVPAVSAPVPVSPATTPTASVAPSAPR